MATVRGESLSELERQAESDRARLARTVDALQDRVTPDALKANAKSYARQTARNLMDGIETQFRANPLQATAIAAGVAYPLWHLISRMPAPILMIGAGLALSRRNGWESNGYDEIYDEDGSTLSRVKDTISSKVDDLKDAASDTASQVTDKIDETIGTVRASASSAASRAEEMLSDTYQRGRETAAQAVNQAGESYVRARDSALEMIEKHPLMVAGIAFAVGSVVASALPVTRRENRLMGETSDALKEHTEEAAAEGMEYAQAAAGKIYDEVSSDVKEHGLTPEGARGAVREVVKTARDSVERAVKPRTGVHPSESALDPATSNRRMKDE